MSNVRMETARLLLMLTTVLVLRDANCATLGSCNFPSLTAIDPQALSLLNGLVGRRYDTGDREYQYAVTICGVFPGVEASVGALQSKATSFGIAETTVLGRTNDANIRFGREWLLLTYSSGDPYSAQCGKQPRETNIMIMCDPDATYGNLQYVHDDSSLNKTSDCSYLFELDHASLCSVGLTSSCASFLIAGMSVGTILIICFFSGVTAYCLIGIAYRRFVDRATGIQLIPNFEFWRDFGELQADGCDFVFRPGNMAFVPLSVPAEEARGQTSYASSRHSNATQSSSTATSRTSSISSASKQNRRSDRGDYEEA